MSKSYYLLKESQYLGESEYIIGIFDNKEEAEKIITNKVENNCKDYRISLVQINEINKLSDPKKLYTKYGKQKIEYPWS
jgi:hypothetical protein